MSRVAFYALSVLLPIGTAFGKMVEIPIQPAANADFSLDVEKSGIWKGRHHSLHFEKYSGVLQYDPDNPAASIVKFTIQAASMTCSDEWLKESDKRKVVDWGVNHMLAASKYPEIVFVSNAATAKSATSYLVSGVLTIRGIGKPATVQVDFQQAAGGGVNFDGQSKVNMRDYGLDPPSAALGTIGTKEVMLVHFHLMTNSPVLLAH